MKVKIENFLIVSDERQYVIKEIKIFGEDSKTPGEEYYISIGYFTTIIKACERLIELIIMKSNTETLGEVISLVKSTKKLIQDSLGE